MNTKRAVAQMLQRLADAGVTHLPKVTLPAAMSKAAGPKAATAAAKPGERPSRLAARTSTTSRPAPPTNTVRSEPATYSLTSDVAAAGVRPDALAETQQLMAKALSSMEQKTEALCALAATVAKCKRCQELAETRTQTVFGVGNPDAKIMFIGEAPGADEDAQGEPFVGRAGKLLNDIIKACKLTREEIYICNILRCRPPGNRNPLPQEAANCREFLDGQIHIVKPEYIVCWGTVAAQNLLNETRPVGKLRKQFFRHGDAKVFCTYHPSYLLRNPSAKKDVWEDMKLFMAELGVVLT